MQKLRLGIYEHYKGKKYLVIGQAKHSETLEDLVIYVCLYENQRTPQHMWARPVSEIFKQKEINGKKVPAFRFTGEV